MYLLLFLSCWVVITLTYREPFAIPVLLSIGPNLPCISCRSCPAEYKSSRKYLLTSVHYRASDRQTPATDMVDRWNVGLLTVKVCWQCRRRLLSSFYSCNQTVGSQSSTLSNFGNNEKTGPAFAISKWYESSQQKSNLTAGYKQKIN